MHINGIQQLGVGVEDVREGFKWYRRNFGMDIKIFEEAAVSELMLAHTNGKKCERHAILAMNMQAGGGFEIWQHTGKKPVFPEHEIQIGDLGIAIGKIKTDNVQKAYNQFKKSGEKLLTEVVKDPAGNDHFYIRDPFNNTWEFCYEPYKLFNTKANNGGIYGCVIGVKDIEESLVIYRDILDYDLVISDTTDVFEDLKGIPGGSAKMRRVILKHSKKRNGAFSPLLGPSSIELIQVLDREAKGIYEGRIWGDPGFIHLCFDVNGIDALREFVREKGYPFTVDSAKAMDTFDMGETAGNFAYLQAKEGTLIEFVETHKVPLLKKLGLYLNLRKRERKPLPNFILRLFSIKRVKN